MTRRRSSRPALLTTLAVLGAIPVASGTAGVILGPGGLPGADPVQNGTVDSEYRFVNVFWLAAGVALWWSLAAPAERAGTTRAVLALAGLGGLPRLLSWARGGAPHPAYRAALALELAGMPAMLVWHRRVFPARR